MNINEKYIKRCLELAENGLGNTYPNPLVGAVVVHENKIIGEGWHHEAGKPHAEVNAIAQVKDESLLKQSTIYVNLEPCSHFGKTPPCSDLIIAKGIKKVVIGMLDPFEKVAGRGIKKLMDAGCQVQVGVLEDQCKALNQRFLTYHLQKRPYIILKWAASQDGYLSPFLFPEIPKNPAPVWITGSQSKQLVHLWRSQEQAILVGANTVLADQPSLTTRLWKGKNPTRVILDPDLTLTAEAKVFNSETKSIWIHDEKIQNKNHSLSVSEPMQFAEDSLSKLMQILYKHEIQSLIVEGGAFTLNQFIQANLWDEARVFTGKSIFKKGTPAPTLPKEKIREEKIIDIDQLKIYRND
ncbi:bifunctional diaminohydroxyphosphoribosylaminopyrimidine deaminase/5-amino-6-(5-phosphoribosylamino)uracil reductase RibD [Psychroflexus planctonicus]|uniref:Riboflavin biosynthesis protein RibD n=1 Tax=Psychroflexus planctonicus TaxID=1526575 RepID=A0ABQ1SGG0_9FLAO|nr:bifunctional diaminohydroxyphosphoribosylaminopyrimidine deaminase/5-amino-6-(5-phosphoribosylamino)uracil reductase RibD [Psychroflexus planctonicus]GGE29304.1 riboflavin biosynthesis protein RibD [Psychroflexus planctonicus]